MDAMPHVNPSDDRLREILSGASTIAVVGASSNPERASYGIMQRLQRSGYKVVPVNPRESEILGELAYAALADIPVPVDIVSVFRRSEDTPPIADEAVAIGARVFWLQSGISSEDAATRAKASGLTVVMDLCIATEHAYLGIPPKRA
jgi:predicted CoA-binding protein